MYCLIKSWVLVSTGIRELVATGFPAARPAGLGGNQAEAAAHLHPGGQPGRVCAHGRPEDHRRHAVAAQAGAGLRQHRHKPAAGGALRFPGRCEYQAPPCSWWQHHFTLFHTCFLFRQKKLYNTCRFQLATIYREIY